MSIKQYGKVRWGTEAIDWQERVNMPRMREERPARARTKMKEHGFAAMILASGGNRRYATAIHAGVLSELIPGASGFTLVFAEENTEDMIDYCLEGNLTKQARIHTGKSGGAHTASSPDHAPGHWSSIHTLPCSPRDTGRGAGD
ncbi:hypothetical protein ACFLTW_05430 [Chloroflexota bacterium]